MTSAPDKHDLIRDIIEWGAFKTGDFTLSSGLKSPYYIDLKKILCDPFFLRLVVQYFAVDLGGGHGFDRFAGVELGGIPLVVACSLVHSKPYVMVRKTPKNHGTEQLIEGPFMRGDSVILVEDVVTTGGSSMRAVKALRDAEFVVESILAVVDREQGGAALFEEAKIPFYPLLKASEILQVATSAAK